MEQPKQILIAGTGKLAEALLSHLHRVPNLELFLWGRNEIAVNRLRDAYRIQSDYSNSLGKMPVLLCVSDNAISEVAEALKYSASCMVHFSGSMSIDVLPETYSEKAVCWPIQTFGNPLAVNWTEVPLCTETRGEETQEFMTWFCTTLGGPRFSLTEEKRRALHLAAIVVNNFTNHLMNLSKRYCEEQRVPFEQLLPLSRQTIGQLTEKDPQRLQTGPARRNDQITIQKHLDMLQNEAELSEIYSMISRQITNRYSS
jgi:predicted short-subunit dehydrogenase-like oxidoreductase (DUF2520 family)